MKSQVPRLPPALMPATVPSTQFICRKCGAPIKLPDDVRNQRFLGCADEFTDASPAALLCIVCKRVDIFSSQSSSPYYDPNSRQVTSFRDGKTEWLSTLLCEGELDEFRVPLLVTWPPDLTVQEKMERAKTWNGTGLQCPAGHRIFWPWAE
jgi:hypothetical protein